MKKIILLLTLFLITGCSADYNLEVGQTIKEELVIPYENHENEIYDKISTLEPVVEDYEGNHIYDIVKKDGKFIISHEYDNIFRDNLISDQCFQNYRFEENEHFVSITAKGMFGCLYDADKVNINIKTDYYVQKENSTKVKDNVYTWVIDPNNRDNVDINIIINKDIEPPKTKVVEKTFNFIWIIVIIIIIVFIFKKFFKNVNK